MVENAIGILPHIPVHESQDQVAEALQIRRLPLGTPGYPSGYLRGFISQSAPVGLETCRRRHGLQGRCTQSERTHRYSRLASHPQSEVPGLLGEVLSGRPVFDPAMGSFARVKLLLRAPTVRPLLEDVAAVLEQDLARALEPGNVR